MRRRRQLLAPVSALATIAVLGACSGDPGPDDSVQSAHVEVGLYNLQGARTGACSGVLLSANRVLTAGHCAVGNARWKVVSPGAQASATASRAYAYDWQNTGQSQPRLHDLAVLVLDSRIELREYPTVATKPVAENAGAIRMRRNGDGGFEAVPAELASAKNLGFALHYGMKLAPGEAVDTGGAVTTPDGRTILAIVHGRGTTTGTLYASRTDVLSTWIANRASCSLSKSPVLTTVTCEEPSGGGGGGGGGCTKDAGVAKVDSGSGSNVDSGSGGGAGNGNEEGDAGSGSGSNGGSGSGSGGSGAGSSSGGGAGGGSCDVGDGVCYGDCLGGGGSTGSGGRTGGGGSGGSGSGSGSGNTGSSGSPGLPSGGGGSGSGSGTGSGSGSGTGSSGDGTDSSGSGGSGGGFGFGGGGSGGFGFGSGSGSGGSSDGVGTGGAGSGAGGTSGSGSPGLPTGGGSGGTGGSGSGSGTGGSGDGTGGSSGGGSGGTSGGTATAGVPLSGGSGGTASSADSVGCYSIPNCKDNVVDYGGCNCSAPYKPPPPPIK